MLEERRSIIRKVIRHPPLSGSSRPRPTLVSALNVPTFTFPNWLGPGTFLPHARQESKRVGGIDGPRRPRQTLS